MLRSIAVAYLNPFNFLNISLIFGNGNGFLFICALSLLKSVMIRTTPVFLALINKGAAHAESELLLNTSMSVSLFISVFVVASKDCGTGSGLAWLCFASSINYNLTGLIFSIPSPSPNNVGNFLSVLPNICFSSFVRCSNY
jgi:hypothetical protein